MTKPFATSRVDGRIVAESSDDTEAIAARLEIAKATVDRRNSWMHQYISDISTLLAALASEKERADELARAAQRLTEVRHGGECGIALDDLDALTAALANYHTATTEPGAEP